MMQCGGLEIRTMQFLHLPSLHDTVVYSEELATVYSAHSAELL